MIVLPRLEIVTFQSLMTSSQISKILTKHLSSNALAQATLVSHNGKTDSVFKPKRSSSAESSRITAYVSWPNAVGTVRSTASDKCRTTVYG